MSELSNIRDLRPDPANIRKHSPRNIGLIRDALTELGAARFIVIDEDGVVLAGNGVIEAATQAGIEKVQVIEADGETIVAVRRRGLTEEQKLRLSLYDNRTGELAKWNTELLAEVAREKPHSLQGIWSGEELEQVMAMVATQPQQDITLDIGPPPSVQGEIIISIDKEKAQREDLRDDLRRFCESYGLKYRVKIL